MSCTISRNIAKEAKMMIPPFTMNDSRSGIARSLSRLLMKPTLVSAGDLEKTRNRRFRAEA